ncbi:hypothetical protein OPT61_g6774 [Boeremia exigua]|uniref:Uncharacterized protein n=1 Tax=Boeremia exigua TaxID=749465 RepID=A0ACC2I655_9PLEO|nr:hypothetical protein OPT61_g6774 [Boeremia exigua]
MNEPMIREEKALLDWINASPRFSTREDALAWLRSLDQLSTVELRHMVMNYRRHLHMTRSLSMSPIQVVAETAPIEPSQSASALDQIQDSISKIPEHLQVLLANQLVAQEAQVSSASTAALNAIGNLESRLDTQSLATREAAQSMAAIENRLNFIEETAQTHSAHLAKSITEAKEVVTTSAQEVTQLVQAQGSRLAALELTSVSAAECITALDSKVSSMQDTLNAATKEPPNEQRHRGLVFSTSRKDYPIAAVSGKKKGGED